MELEHESVTEKQFGPKVSLLKGRVLGAIIIVAILGFLALVVFVSPRGDGPIMTPYGSVDTEPMSVWTFVLLSLGLAATALVVPLLANIGAKEDPPE